MSAVTMKIVEGTNSVVRAYATNPDYGFIQLVSKEVVLGGSWTRVVSKSTLMKGDIPTLKLMEVQFKNGLPGRIQIWECLENDIPAQFEAELNQKVAFEDAIKDSLKSAGKGGPTLVVGDQRILRFTAYDASGLTVDNSIQHTNVEEVKAWKASVSTGGGAQFEG